MSLGNISSESDRSSGEEREGLQHPDQGQGVGGGGALGGLRVAALGAPMLLWPVWPSPLGSMLSFP